MDLRNYFLKCLIDLSISDGISASSKDEIFGCIFGRDTAITVLKILKVYSKDPNPKLLAISKKALITLVKLQGKEFNLNSGEEPGKFIHEFRKEKFEHLLNSNPPWFIYPDGFLRNYDSIDSTPLTLIALYRYCELTKDKKFLINILDAVEAGLNWILNFGNKNKDTFIEYDFPKKRKYGGLSVQSWTDSRPSLEDVNGNLPKYPIAPIEAQSFAWLALKLWGDYYQYQHPRFARTLISRAENLKNKFNQKFLIKDKGLYFGAQALDGRKRKIKTITANPLLVLWAAYQKEGKSESILQKRFIKDFVKRGFMDDLFVKDAGIRTMSSLSPTFNPNQDSYHNGSFWPMLNGLIIEGLENFGFFKEAKKLKKAASLPLYHFATPIELYTKVGGKYLEYRSKTGQVSCKKQVWSAAAALDFLTINQK